MKIVVVGSGTKDLELGKPLRKLFLYLTMELALGIGRQQHLGVAQGTFEDFDIIEQSGRGLGGNSVIGHDAAILGV